MKTKTIVLTLPEAKHLLTLLADAAERGDYYGNRTQYWRRHQRIIDKLEHAPEDQAMTDQTPDTIRALADRLERRADIEDVGEVRYPQEDVPEVTWEEMREIVGLLREAASTLRALADPGPAGLRVSVPVRRPAWYSGGHPHGGPVMTDQTPDTIRAHRRL